LTYCLGILVKDGLALLADTRTNAGVDNVSTYRELRIFGNDGRRLIAIASAGSLSTTQVALERATVGIRAPDTGNTESIHAATSIHRVAYLLGQAVRFTREEMEGPKQQDVTFDAILLVGGSVGGEPTRLFLVYGAGNFIECGEDSPCLQIGEVKYGKPILDRALSYDTALDEAVKIALISFSSTMGSDLAVGLPIDLVKARPGQGKAELIYRIDEDDDYFRELNESWSQALRAAQGRDPEASVSLAFGPGAVARREAHGQVAVQETLHRHGHRPGDVALAGFHLQHPLLALLVAAGEPERPRQVERGPAERFARLFQMRAGLDHGGAPRGRAGPRAHRPADHGRKEAIAEVPSPPRKAHIPHSLSQN
jgi:putative proteasome-type protease